MQRSKVRLAALVFSATFAFGALGASFDVRVVARARDAAETMRASIPDVHAKALAQKAAAEDIELAQRALTKEKEYMGPINGELDRVTINAIQAFQRRHEMRDTGILNRRTMARLREALG